MSEKGLNTLRYRAKSVHYILQNCLTSGIVEIVYCKRELD